jgi:hypothetical protein
MSQNRYASGYERGRHSEPDNYLCKPQRFAHTRKTIIEGFAYQSGVFPGDLRAIGPKFPELPGRQRWLNSNKGTKSDIEITPARACLS